MQPLSNSHHGASEGSAEVTSIAEHSVDVGEAGTNNADSSQAETADSSSSVDQEQLRAQIAEEDLALLLRKAQAASQTVKKFNASAEEGLQQFLQAYQSLLTVEGYEKSEEIEKMKLEMQACTSDLRKALQEISLLTSRVEDLGGQNEQEPINL